MKLRDLEVGDDGRYARAGRQMSVALGADHDGADAPLGPGLGPYICKAIVEHHRGEIGLRSAPGGGAIYWFALPRRRWTDEQGRHRHPQQAGARHAQWKE